MEKNNKKTIHHWCMYDWANSVYSLVITSSIFPAYYEAVTRNADGSDGVEIFGVTLSNTVWYSYALSLSFLVVALIMPRLG
ncbi:MAG: MFS transporter, partial [Cytophagales bacterium]|nr:MFS transporter [Cytophagales bacterium]